ncbi:MULTISPECIES: hypothetical protein [Actinosynnema]|uniref:hypothetical protein n=1 Tax=Actinosynnema TaxID=40566 RepID=UPI0020A47A65|nr:hypothetical protein [Actinosynnema pretiosum]MCP2097382.1 hypothetical protein [Actinosynnema pretiosum]
MRDRLREDRAEGFVELARQAEADRVAAQARRNELLHRAYQSGVSARSLATAIGLSHTGVLRAIRNHGNRAPDA